MELLLVKKKVFIDLDGTLISGPLLQVKQSDLECLKLYEDRFDFNICTGRSEVEINCVVANTGLKVSGFVGLNGMVSSIRKVEFFESFRELIKLLAVNEINFEGQDNIMRYFTDSMWLDSIKNNFTMQLNMFDLKRDLDKNYYKVVVRAKDNVEDLKVVMSLIEENFSDCFECVLNDNKNIEITKKGITKLCAIKEITGTDDYIMIGDSNNDLEALVYAST